MIIFGTRGITTTPERGNFHCPQCRGASTNYNLKRVRRFFTLYFIPVIPLDKLGEYVECTSCQGTYDPEILSYDPTVEGEKMEAFFFIACKQVMISMLLADGHIDDNEVKMLQAQFQQITGTHVPEAELREEITYISQQGSSAIEILSSLAHQMNDAGKEIVIRAAYSIAAADGNIDDSEQAYMMEVGTALGMSEAHLTGVLTTAMAQPALNA